MASLDPAGSTESQTIVNLSELTAGHALGTAGAPDASATSIPEPALQPQIPPNGLSPTSNYAYPNANTENSAYGGSAELGHLGAATSPTNTHFTLSRKEQLRRKKEDDDDEDWERRLYWVRDLADILGVEGLLKYDPNDGYKLRRQEKARREVEKVERRRAREGRTWFWLGGSAQPSTDLDMDETNGSINEKPDGQTTSPAVALPTAPSPVSRESTAAPSEDDDLDYQMIMDLVSNATKDMFPDGEVPPLPTDPTDPEYRENIHEFSQLAVKASRKSFYHWTCCGLFPVFWPQWRLVLRRTIRDPRFSIWANLWSLFMAFIIVISLATLVMDSVQSLMVIPEWRGALVITGLVVLAVFALELALLWTTMKDLGEFFSWTNFVNIVTVFPPLIVIFIRLIYDNKLNREDAGFAVLTVMQHLLVLRVFKLTELSKRSNRMTLIFEAVKQSGDGILSLFVADFILMIFFSTIIFYAEGSGMFLDQQTGMWYYNEQYGGQISPFQNIPVTFWFVIVSITTTGAVRNRMFRYCRFTNRSVCRVRRHDPQDDRRTDLYQFDADFCRCAAGVSAGDYQLEFRAAIEGAGKGKRGETGEEEDEAGKGCGAAAGCRVERRCAAQACVESVGTLDDDYAFDFEVGVGDCACDTGRRSEAGGRRMDTGRGWNVVCEERFERGCGRCFEGFGGWFPGWLSHRLRARLGLYL